MAGLSDVVKQAAEMMYRGEYIVGEFNVQHLLHEAPVEVRAAFDMAIERGDFVRAADVIGHEWPEK